MILNEIRELSGIDISEGENMSRRGFLKKITLVAGLTLFPILNVSGKSDFDPETDKLISNTIEAYNRYNKWAAEYNEKIRKENREEANKLTNEKYNEIFTNGKTKMSEFFLTNLGVNKRVENLYEDLIRIAKDRIDDIKTKTNIEDLTNLFNEEIKFFNYSLNDELNKSTKLFLKVWQNYHKDKIKNNLIKEKTLFNKLKTIKDPQEFKKNAIEYFDNNIKLYRIVTNNLTNNEEYNRRNL